MRRIATALLAGSAMMALAASDVRGQTSRETYYPVSWIGLVGEVDVLPLPGAVKAQKASTFV